MAFAPALGALVAVFGPLNFIFGKWKSFLASRFYTDEKDTITCLLYTSSIFYGIPGISKTASLRFGFPWKQSLL